MTILHSGQSTSERILAPIAILVALGLYVAVLAIPSASGTSTTSATSGWDSAEPIEDDSARAFLPAVAVDAQGNAIAVWQSDALNWKIWANRYVAGVGWGTAERIQTTPGGVLRPDVAVSKSGNATAVWTQSDGTRGNVWANLYISGIGWQTAQLIENDDVSDAFDPQVGADAVGNAVVVWTQFDGVRPNVLANRYVAGVGWGTPELIDTELGDVFGPRVAVDGAGKAIAVWSQRNATSLSIWSNRYVPGVGWGAATTIEGAPGDALDPEVAVDGAGHAIAVWHQDDGVRFSIWANRYVPGIGWGAAQSIGTGDGVAGAPSRPQVSLGRDGTAVAVWEQDVSGRFRLYANRFTPGQGWGTERPIDGTLGGTAWSPQVVVDDAGNALVVWQHSVALQGDIYSNRNLPGVGWGIPELVETNNAGDADDPQVAVDDRGNAIAVWYQSDGFRFNIWANRYVAPDLTPPTLLVSRPQDGTTTDSATISVSGTTEPGVSLTVNGLMVVVAADGAFAIQIALQEGPNAIVAIARDDAGNEATVTLTVTYNDPASRLDQELRDTRRALNNTMDFIQRELAALRILVVTTLAVAGAILVSLVLTGYWRRKTRSPSQSKDRPRQ